MNRTEDSAFTRIPSTYKYNKSFLKSNANNR